MSEKIIKYLKNSIDEKGNYCYSLPVETTKAVIKELDRLNNIINDMEKEIDRLLERQYESEKFAKEQGFDTYLPAKENLLWVKNKLKELNRGESKYE